MAESGDPWYRSNSFWGLAGTTVAIVLIVVASLVKDLRWLLLVAWPFGCIALWTLARSVYSSRGDVRLFTILGSLLAASVLAYLNSFLKPDVNSPTLTEQARLEIRGVEDASTSRYGSPALNVSFYNAGRLPATNVLHYYNLATAARILSEPEVTEIQDRMLGFVKPGEPHVEINPGQGNDSTFTIPESPGESRTIDLLSRDLNHVLDGSRLLYLLVAFSYRDRMMPSDAFRISESCVYFVRTFDVGQACGRNGTSEEKIGK